jgi:cysteine desulfurase
MKKIYLDYAATTPLDPVVSSKMDQIGQRYFANPSSIHSMGQQSKVIIEEARNEIASALNAKPREIIFTSGGTESINMALVGTALANKKKGNHIITTRAEHPAVLESIAFLKSIGFEISYLDIGETGNIIVDDLKHILRANTILVSVMMVNNETGCVFPVEKITKYLANKNIIVHTDAIQALGKLAINVEELEIDLLSISAHKIYGPKGIGILYLKDGIPLKNILYGGGQESTHRPGTENIVAIAGFAEAFKQISIKNDMYKKIANLRNFFEAELKKVIPKIEINGLKAERVITHSNIYFPFLSADTLLMNLDLHGVAASSGSACSSGSVKPSHVLKAMGFTDERINGSIRFSLGLYTSEDDIRETIKIIEKIYKREQQRKQSYA